MKDIYIIISPAYLLALVCPVTENIVYLMYVLQELTELCIYEIGKLYTIFKTTVKYQFGELPKDVKQYIHSKIRQRKNEKKIC